jgi:signal transduction histidine kinase
VSFSLNKCTAQALSTIQKNASDKGIVLINEILPDAYVFADQDMIQLVVRNLLTNAVKFCRDGNSITVSAERKGAVTEVCVADTGSGISEEVLQKINSGESVTTYGTSKEKGTGLGLLLVKDFIVRNNGSFRVESTLGKGSRFYFTLGNAG